MKRYIYLLIILFLCLLINHLVSFKENLSNNNDNGEVYKVQLVKDQPTGKSCDKYIKLVKKNNSDLDDYEK